MSLSEDDRSELGGLIAAALRPQPEPETVLTRLSIAEIIRQWIWHVSIGVFMLAAGIWQYVELRHQVKHNTALVDANKYLKAHVLMLEKKMREVRPLVRQHEWQRQNGLTNKDLKLQGITAPEFPEEDYSIYDVESTDLRAPRTD